MIVPIGVLGIGFIGFLSATQMSQCLTVPQGGKIWFVGFSTAIDIKKLEVEYVKEPENIDEAVYYKISNIQPRSMRMTYGEKRKKIVRSTKSEVETEVLSENDNDIDEDERINRVPIDSKLKSKV